MILVADSGSSKTDWMLAPEKISFKTAGMNPFFISEKDMIKMLNHSCEIRPYADQVTEIYFFGAGCSNPDRRESVSNALSQVFKNAFVSVESDLTGSVYATCGDKEGLSCILGTGSNISCFDGTRIQPGRHGVGYILGDEGSGTWFGKRLITSFLYGTMPRGLKTAFNDTYHPAKEGVVKAIYEDSAPNFYLASFAKFMSNYSQHPFIINLLKEGFEEFVETNIKSYPQYTYYTCHFTGSIAWHFQSVLHKMCEYHHVKVGKILKQPIEELFKFIISRL